MMVDNLNKTKIHSQIDKVVEQLKCIIDDHSATYVSIPISSGKRFVNWYKKGGKDLLQHGDGVYRTELYECVIKKNMSAAIKKIRKIRSEIEGPLIDPTKLEFLEWEQDEYRYYWGKVIEKYAKRAMFFDGWEFSNGCSFEFLKAMGLNLECTDENLEIISHKKALKMLEASILGMRESNLKTDYIERVLQNLSHLNEKKIVNLLTATNKISKIKSSENPSILFKDEILNDLAWSGNVAQFVSFRPDKTKKCQQSYCRIYAFEPNHIFDSLKQAISHLIRNSPEKKINIRSYLPDNPKGYPLIYGITNVETALSKVNELTSKGLYTIVNETIDIEDGGVSGVCINDLIEFSPNDTPKCVDKPGVCRLPKSVGVELLSKVYGFRPKISFDPNYRIEFSIHPQKVGFLREHTILWEIEHVENKQGSFSIHWPNNFSKFIGDKTFGLLLADSIDVPVPKTCVIPRNVAPFFFGQPTGTFENWIRTCPEIPEPGYYTTEFGWKDPFELIKEQNNKNVKTPIMAILSQESVNPLWSGALLPGEDKEKPFIQGVSGRGDKFMIGAKDEEIPLNVIDSVTELYENIVKKIGLVKIEWVFDGKRAWCVQMHKTQHFQSDQNIIVPSKNKSIEYHDFKIDSQIDTKEQLDELRKLIKSIKNKSMGISLIGDIGVTSHFGDILRKANIPSKIESSFQ